MKAMIKVLIIATEKNISYFLDLNNRKIYKKKASQDNYKQLFIAILAIYMVYGSLKLLDRLWLISNYFPLIMVIIAVVALPFGCLFYTKAVSYPSEGFKEVQQKEELKK